MNKNPIIDYCFSFAISSFATKPEYRKFVCLYVFFQGRPFILPFHYLISCEFAYQVELSYHIALGARNSHTHGYNIGTTCKLPFHCSESSVVCVFIYKLCVFHGINLGCATFLCSEFSFVIPYGNRSARTHDLKKFRRTL